MSYSLLKKLDSAHTYNRCLFILDNGPEDLPPKGPNRPYEYSTGSIAWCPYSGKAWMSNEDGDWKRMLYGKNPTDVKIYEDYNSFPNLTQLIAQEKLFYEDKIFIAKDTQAIYIVKVEKDEQGMPVKAWYERILQDVHFVKTYSELPDLSINNGLNLYTTYLTLDDNTFYVIIEENDVKKYKRIGREVHIVNNYAALPIIPSDNRLNETFYLDKSTNTFYYIEGNQYKRAASEIRIVNSKSDLPNVSDIKIEGTTYWVKSENALFIDDNGTWQEISSSIKTISYNDWKALSPDKRPVLANVTGYQIDTLNKTI